MAKPKIIGRGEFTIRQINGHFVYRIYDASGELLYVGRTSSLFGRMAKHLAQQPWRSKIHRIELTELATARDAERYEWDQIQALAPLHNVVGAPRRVIPLDPVPYDGLSDEQKDRQAIRAHRARSFGDSF